MSFNRLVDKAVSLLYWKENQVKTMKPFWSRSNDIPKFKYLEIICCIITYSHASRFISAWSWIVLWCLVLLSRVSLYDNKITFKDC